MLVEVNTTPVRTDLAGTDDLEQVAVDLEGLAADQKMWTDRWDQLLQLGEVAPEG